MPSFPPCHLWPSEELAKEEGELLLFLSGYSTQRVGAVPYLGNTEELALLKGAQHHGHENGRASSTTCVP